MQLSVEKPAHCEAKFTTSIWLQGFLSSWLCTLPYPTVQRVCQMAHYHPLYPGDVGVFDVRSRHFRPQLSLKQGPRISSVYSEALNLGVPIHVRTYFKLCSSSVQFILIW